MPSPGERFWLSNSVVIATSVSHSVAGGTQVRVTQPKAPMARVRPISSRPRHHLRTVMMLNRLGNDSTTAAASEY